jgi:phosphoribosylformimino-5-aminoimidazole carboxamide ribotide isomerase
MDVIPAVDILAGAVVRLMQGDYGEVTEYGRDPVAAARRWLDAGAELVHVIDLDGARDGRPDIETWDSLGAAGVPYQLGGGVRTAESAVRAVSAGAERVILGTAAVWHPDVLEASVAAAGADRIVASVDVKDGRATGAGWLDEGRATEEVVSSALATGVHQFLVTAVARDGTMSGPDLDLLARVIDLSGGAYVMCAGGIGSLDHVRAARDAGAGGVVMGRALYEGAFRFEDALALGSS